MLDADILVVATPVWLSQPSAVCKMVLERLDAELGETDDEGRLLTYGKVGGWVENGRKTDYRTRFAGAYDRATGADPFALAPALLARRKAIDEAGALDFVYAADTIGGNSGSPVIDKDANVIGANFDRNIHGLRNDYAYDLTMARSIAVSTAALEQALKHVYPAPALLAELHGK